GLSGQQLVQWINTNFVGRRIFRFRVELLEKEQVRFALNLRAQTVLLARRARDFMADGFGNLLAGGVIQARKMQLSCNEAPARHSYEHAMRSGLERSKPKNES